MSLDVSLNEMRPTTVFSRNITHNLGEMASKVSEEFYKAIWRPEELNITIAKELENYLFDGLLELKSKPDYYKQFNPKNGWGTYLDLVMFVEQYLWACQESPYAKIGVSR